MRKNSSRLSNCKNLPVSTIFGQPQIVCACNPACHRFHVHENVSATNIKVHRNVPVINCRCIKSSQPQILCAPPLPNSVHLMCWWLDSFSCTYCAGKKTGGLNPLWWGSKWCCYDLWSICGQQEIRLPNSSYNLQGEAFRYNL